MGAAAAATATPSEVVKLNGGVDLGEINLPDMTLDDIRVIVVIWNQNIN